MYYRYFVYTNNSLITSKYVNMEELKFKKELVKNILDNGCE